MRKRLLYCDPQRAAPKFEKFRRNWSEKNSMKRFLRKRFETQHNAFYGSR
ncbi:hypothetical protein [Leptospira noguchii]|nr:hypothetical protein [Leptospira noguchii]UOG28933.1 hypothetical protein MAL06_09340 [Leptospira noguchii]